MDSIDIFYIVTFVLCCLCWVAIVALQIHIRWMRRKTKERGRLLDEQIRDLRKNLNTP